MRNTQMQLHPVRFHFERRGLQVLVETVRIRADRRRQQKQRRCGRARRNRSARRPART
jgi:hypothetical protein